MCFVCIWEQTAIISLYSINWLVFITGTECVYCAVRTECLNKIQLNLSHPKLHNNWPPQFHNNWPPQFHNNWPPQFHNNWPPQFHNNWPPQFISVRHKPSVLLVTRRKQRCRLVYWQQLLESEVLCNLIGYLLDNVFNRLLYDRLHVRDQLPGVFIQSSISGFTCDRQTELQCTTLESFISLTVCSPHRVNVTTGASSLSLLPPSPAENLPTEHEHELNKVPSLPWDDTKVSGSRCLKENLPSRILDKAQWSL